MDVKFKKQEDKLIVYLTGEIDHHKAEECRDLIDKRFENSNARDMVFDFQGIHFMDSSGIGMIIGRYKKVKEKGGMVSVVHVNENLKKIFTLSGLGKIIQI